MQREKGLYALRQMEKWAELPVPSPVYWTVARGHPCLCVLRLKLHSSRSYGPFCGRELKKAFG